METDDRKAVVARIADEIWNRGNLAAVEDVMASDARYHGPHMPGGSGGRDDWRAAIAMYRGAFPDARVTFEELLVSGDRIVGRWSATGTHTGDLPGVPPTGKGIAISGITVYRFAEGRIAEAWEELDLLGMWQQLGLFRGPGHGHE
jgi:steroid delta-isomerase-like uncharacterized protein